MFADPWWKAQFYRFVTELIDISEDLRRNVKLPGFLNILELEVNRLKIACEHLGRHLLEARREGGPCVWHDPPGKNLYLAYRWTYTLFASRKERPCPWEMDAVTLRKLEWLPDASLIDTLRRIHDLIPADEPEAPASPPADPSPPTEPDGPTERTEAAGPPVGSVDAGPAGSARPPSGGTNRPAARSEAAIDRSAPPPKGEPAGPADHSGTAIEPAAAGTGGSPRADSQAAAADASGSERPPR